MAAECKCPRCGRVFQRKPPVLDKQRLKKTGYVGLGDVDQDIEALRRAGLDAWDAIEDPEAFIEKLRG